MRILVSESMRFFVVAITISLCLFGCDPDSFNPGDSPALSYIAEVNVSPAGNPLGAVLTWETDEPSSSWVEFTDEIEDGTYNWKWQIGRDNLTQDHTINVVGMTPEKTFYLRAVSVSEDGERLESVPYQFKTSWCGVDFTSERTKYDPEKSLPGWWLSAVSWGDKASISMPVIFNEEGLPVWCVDSYDGVEGYMAYEATFNEDEGVVGIGGHIGLEQHPVAVDMAGNVAWEGVFQQPEQDLDHGTMHHTMYWTDDGKLVGLAINFKDCNGANDCSPISDVLYEVDPQATDLAEWPASEEPILVQEVADWVLDMDPYIRGDYLGMYNNALSFDREEGTVYYYHHQGDQLIKVGVNGDEYWAAGLDGEFTLLNGELWPQKAHGMEYVGNDTVLWFDNGGPGEDGSQLDTRIVKIRFNENDRTAEVVWQYPEVSSSAENQMGSYIGGDADELPNGNVLVATGIDEEPFLHRLFEVTPELEIVREVVLSGDDVYGNYAVDHMPAQATRIDD
ncbi:MAG: aryl-sulfate sulfotransferase [Candidatus Kerfeldbacteria bacterium]